MIEEVDREHDVLKRARRALSPSREDEKRVLTATLAAATPPTEPAVESAAVTSATTLPVVLARAGLGILALATAGLAGYGWGYRAGLAEHSTAVVAAPSGPAERREQPPDGAGRTSPSAASTNAQLQAAPASPTTTVHPPPWSGRHSAGSAAPARKAADAGAGLDEEVRQLRRIERAIREGNPRLALVIGEDLDRAIPKGQLLLERRAARTMASCQLDVEGAAAEAERFIEEHGGSGYVARLRDLCRLPISDQRN